MFIFLHCNLFTEIIPGNTKHPCNILIDVLLAVFCLCLAPSRMILASVGYFCFTYIPYKRAIPFFGFIFNLLLSFMKWFLFLIFIYLKRKWNFFFCPIYKYWICSVKARQVLQTGKGKHIVHMVLELFTQRTTRQLILLFCRTCCQARCIHTYICIYVNINVLP